MNQPITLINRTDMSRLVISSAGQGPRGQQMQMSFFNDKNGTSANILFDRSQVQLLINRLFDFKNSIDSVNSQKPKNAELTQRSVHTSLPIFTKDGGNVTIRQEGTIVYDIFIRSTIFSLDSGTEFAYRLVDESFYNNENSDLDELISELSKL